MYDKRLTNRVDMVEQPESSAHLNSQILNDPIKDKSDFSIANPINDDSDESSLTDIAGQEIVKCAKASPKKFEEIDKSSCKSNANISPTVVEEVQESTKHSDSRDSKQSISTSEPAPSDTKYVPLSNSRRGSTNSDLSIAIAIGGGRGKRAAASKALEKTHGMYYNLPPLVEETIALTEAKKIKKPHEEFFTEESSKKTNHQLKNENSAVVPKKEKKKDCIAVKNETDVASVKTEGPNHSEFKENFRMIFKIAFTGGHKDNRKPLESMIRKFGGSVVESWSECTHLVTDKIRRTSKFLCALSTGKFIMNNNWLDACRKNGSFLGNFMANNCKKNRHIC